jgi:hypothetical protein
MDTSGKPYPIQVTMVRWQVQETVRGELNWVFMSDEFNANTDFLYSQFKADVTCGGQYQTDFTGNEKTGPQRILWDFHNWTQTNFYTGQVKSFRKIKYLVLEGPQ